MTVHIEASYHATDGSAPECVKVEWEGGAMPTVSEICTIIEMLASVCPRYEIGVKSDEA